ncbi:MAG: hypothetical protein B5M55_08665 [Desulfococcus sp. 4484_242]|nr:MAG: hypothetical protein B5M55_08665 [Desulfococcus sp. 4484_242]
MEKAKEKVNKLKARIANLPKRISAKGLFKLRRERDLIADSIKMVAYHAESKLREMLDGSFSRNDDEGRTLLHAVFQSSGRLEISNGELKVTLEPQSSPHRSAAVAALCQKINLMKTNFPGTALRLTYAVELPKPDNF